MSRLYINTVQYPTFLCPILVYHCTVNDLCTRTLVLPTNIKALQPDIINRMLKIQRKNNAPEPIFCNNAENMVMEVSLGNGVGVMPRLLAENNKSNHVNVITAYDVHESMDYVIMYNKKKAKPGIEAFVRTCIKLMNS